jgi:hypothetical protein
MADEVTVFQPGERFVTMGKDGRAFMWLVTDNGNVIGRLNHNLDRRVGIFETEDE